MAEPVEALAPTEVTREPGQDDTQERKWAKAPNPFGVESKLADSGRVRLLKSQTDEQRRTGEGAWVIRFDTAPNELKGHSKETPHPVIAYLKSEGYRWGFDADSKGGWGKPFQGDPAGTDLLEAQRVMRKAAEMVGAKVEAERSPF